MQRHEKGLVVISCDFTGADWDEEAPMIEGHRGSVLSLAALALAVAEAEARPAEKGFPCTMCRRDYPAGEKAWRHANPPAGANPEAVICWAAMIWKTC